VIAKLLQWAALPVTDRRWAAPLSAVALGFGLFAGVAIGPGAAGTFGTGVAQVIEIPGFSGGTDTAGEGGDASSPPAAAASSFSGTASGSEGVSIPALEPAPPLEATTPDSQSPPQPTDLNLALADAVPVSQPDAPSESECADLATILWQIYAADPSSLPFSDTAALREWICAATPAQASERSSH
jgi:hypothetical protein